MMFDGRRCLACGDEVAVNERLITNGFHVECEPNDEPVETSIDCNELEAKRRMDLIDEHLAFLNELFPPDSGRPVPEVRARDHEGERGL